MPTNDVTGEMEQRRLPYEPPAIEETSEFETLALECGHTPNSPSSACQPAGAYGGEGEPSSG
jgi:hypothetical protein